VNLAIVLTQLGRRVLLVDADLRRPSVHRMLRLPNHAGLSTFLTGNASLDDVIQSSPIPELKIVTAGPIPPTPSELLGSSGLDLLLDRERLSRFDHVLFDSPPLVSVTDSIILSARTDSTIVVVRAGTTSREALSHGIRRLQHTRTSVTGAVLNAVSEQTGYYYSSYGRLDGEDAATTREPGARAVTEPASRRAGLA
jgi:capsular exopolysaccharide synthesis family protein